MRVSNAGRSMGSLLNILLLFLSPTNHRSFFVEDRRRRQGELWKRGLEGLGFRPAAKSAVAVVQPNSWGEASTRL